MTSCRRSWLSAPSLWFSTCSSATCKQRLQVQKTGESTCAGGARCLSLHPQPSCYCTVLRKSFAQKKCFFFSSGGGEEKLRGVQQGGPVFKSLWKKSFIVLESHSEFLDAQASLEPTPSMTNSFHKAFFPKFIWVGLSITILIFGVQELKNGTSSPNRKTFFPRQKMFHCPPNPRASRHNDSGAWIGSSGQGLE